MKQREFAKNSYVVTTGIGIGWLVGLSVSPVVSILITSVTGAAATIVAAMSGLEDKTDKPAGDNKREAINYRFKINPLPLTLLVVGILLGSTLGILARNQSWLGSSLSAEVNQWSHAGLTDAGLTHEEIALKIFENRYTSTTGTPAINPLTAALFAQTGSECKTLQAEALRSPIDNLVSALRSSTVKQFRTLPDMVTDPQTLKTLVEEVLCADLAG